MDDATLVKPRNIGYILRSTSSAEEYLLEGEMIVGREVECAIAIHSGHISRYHAKINVMRSGVFIEDLHSTNGTYINGKRIKGRVRLNLGDEITFDDIPFKLTSTQDAQEDKTLLSPRRVAADDTSLHSGGNPKTSNVQPFPSRGRITKSNGSTEPMEEDLFAALDLERSDNDNTANAASSDSDKPQVNTASPAASGRARLSDEAFDDLDLDLLSSAGDTEFKNESDTVSEAPVETRGNSMLPDQDRDDQINERAEVDDSDLIGQQATASTSSGSEPPTDRDMPHLDSTNSSGPAEAKQGDIEVEFRSHRKPDPLDELDTEMDSDLLPDFEPDQAETRRPAGNPPPPQPSPMASRAQQEQMEDEQDSHTRIMSSDVIGQFVERNRAMHKDINLGNGPRIIIMTAPLRGQYFELYGEQTSWKIGRAVDADIRLTDKTISSDHARILEVDEGFMLKTSHARNAILVNGRPTKSAHLNHNDSIQVGGTELVFKTDYPSPTDTRDTHKKPRVDDRSMTLRHSLIGAAVVLVLLITVLVASTS